MRNLMRLAGAVNLMFASIFAYEMQWLFALGNFVAACLILVPMDDAFGSPEA